MKSELLIVVISWLGLEMFFLFNSYNEFVHHYTIVIFDLGRNFTIAIISGLLPLYMSFRLYHLPTYITKEFASDFSLLMMNEKTYSAFSDYLKVYDINGYNYLSFYTELNVFRHKQSSGITNMIATDIHGRYLHPSSKCYIEFPESYVIKLQNSYKNCEKNKYDNGFDSLCEYAFLKLRDEYFYKFKNTPHFKKLEAELEKDETIYTRLIASSMIMNSA